MADLNVDNCVVKIFEGNLGINYNFKYPATKIVTWNGEVNTETCDDQVLQRQYKCLFPAPRHRVHPRWLLGGIIPSLRATRLETPIY